MVTKPVSQGIVISDEAGSYRAAVTSDNALKVTSEGAGTGDVNIVEVGGNAVTTSVPVGVANGADVALGSTTDDAYTGTEPYTLMSAVRAVANAAISTAASPANITQTGGQNLAADDAAAGTTYPLPMGGIYNSSALPSYANLDRVQAQFASDGSIRSALVGANITPADGQSNVEIDGYAIGSVSGTRRVGVYPYGFNGSTWDRIRANTTGQIVIPPQGWQYAAASGGIVNTTTAVTIKAAAGSGVRNYLSSIEINTDTLGAATEIAIRDGAAGTVLWRQKLQTTALPVTSITFQNPLVGTANTLMEVVTLTASVTGGVFVNAQGYTAP